MIEARPARFEDWQDIEHVLLRLSSSRFSAWLSCNRQETQYFLMHSLCLPQSVGLLVEHWDGEPIGLCALLLVDSPRAGVPGIGVARHGFIHSVFVDPCTVKGARVPSEAGHVMMEAIENWCKERGAGYVYGNVRMDGHFEALHKKFGMIRQHMVVGKEIGGNHGQ